MSDDLPLFELGQKVRLKRDVRADGTYSFAKMGEIIAYEGEEGYVRNIGSFLQTIRVYDVDFIASGRLIGCREEELENADNETNIKSEIDEDLAVLQAHRQKHK
ncbi:MAG: nitrogen fixation protein NifZ [Helicobacteraceae bacterium]|jgi:nitrogen fixation protein NifZ|nr:nitrogen fixation protein NifZ [Helicobacteraceae bacterium]